MASRIAATAAAAATRGLVDGAVGSSGGSGVTLPVPLPMSWPYVIDTSVSTFELFLGLLRKPLPPIPIVTATASANANANANANASSGRIGAGHGSLSPIRDGGGGGGGGGLRQLPHLDVGTSGGGASGPTDGASAGAGTHVLHQLLVWRGESTLRASPELSTDPATDQRSRSSASKEAPHPTFVLWSVLFCTLRLLKANVQHLLLCSESVTSAANSQSWLEQVVEEVTLANAQSNPRADAHAHFNLVPGSTLRAIRWTVARAWAERA